MPTIGDFNVPGCVSASRPGTDAAFFNALVAQIFGLKHVSMLSGAVFFGHQIGGFLGAWLGGVIFTRTGSYDLAWWISIGLGVFAAVVCAPISERPLARPAAATA